MCLRVQYCDSFAVDAQESDIATVLQYVDWEVAAMPAVVFYTTQIFFNLNNYYIE